MATCTYNAADQHALVVILAHTNPRNHRSQASVLQKESANLGWLLKMGAYGRDINTSIVELLQEFNAMDNSIPSHKMQCFVLNTNLHIFWAATSTILNHPKYTHSSMSRFNLVLIKCWMICVIHSFWLSMLLTTWSPRPTNHYRNGYNCDPHQEPNWPGINGACAKHRSRSCHPVSPRPGTPGSLVSLNRSDWRRSRDLCVLRVAYDRMISMWGAAWHLGDWGCRRFRALYRS
jgi:hypothetical protein